MTPLAVELHRILSSGEVLMASSFPAILHAIGYGTDRVELPEVEIALAELIDAGLVGRQWRRGRCYFAALPGQKAAPSRDDGPGGEIPRGPLP